MSQSNANSNHTANANTNVSNTHMGRDGFTREVRMLRNPPRAMRGVSPTAVRNVFRTYNQIRRMFGHSEHESYLSERASTGMTFARMFLDARRRLSQRFARTSVQGEWNIGVEIMRHLTRKYPIGDSRGPEDNALIMAFLLTFIHRASWYAELVQEVQQTEGDDVYGIPVRSFDAMHTSFRMYKVYMQVQGDTRRFRNALMNRPIRPLTRTFDPRPRERNRAASVPAWVQGLRERNIPSTVNEENRISLTTLNRMNRAVPLRCGHWVAKEDIEGMAKAGRALQCPYCRAPIEASNFS